MVQIKQNLLRLSIIVEATKNAICARFLFNRLSEPDKRIQRCGHLYQYNGRSKYMQTADALSEEKRKKKHCTTRENLILTSLKLRICAQHVHNPLACTAVVLLLSILSFVRIVVVLFSIQRERIEKKTGEIKKRRRKETRTNIFFGLRENTRAIQKC